MAKIDIEQKKNIWPWILGLIILALIVWAVIALLDNDDYAEVAAATPTALDGTVVAARFIEPAALARVETT